MTLVGVKLKVSYLHLVTHVITGSYIPSSIYCSAVVLLEVSTCALDPGSEQRHIGVYLDSGCRPDCSGWGSGCLFYSKVATQSSEGDTLSFPVICSLKFLYLE